MYSDGDGVPHDMTRAAELFLKAANGGNAIAQMHIGYLYLTGEGAQKNMEEGARWTRIAADNGNADAMANMAALCRGEIMPRRAYRAAYRLIERSLKYAGKICRSSVDNRSGFISRRRKRGVCQ
jgi:TPR repeat protein